MRKAAVTLTLSGLLAMPVAQARPADYASSHSEACAELATITYLAGTAPLSKHDQQRLAEETREAAKPAALRAAIPQEEIMKAETRGRTSHGNYGEGRNQLDTAREDAFMAALYVQEECLHSDLADLH